VKTKNQKNNVLEERENNFV